MELKRRFMPSIIMKNLKEYGNCSFAFKEISLGNEEVFKGLEIEEENMEVKAYAIKRRGSITERKEATYEEILIALAKSITSSLKGSNYYCYPKSMELSTEAFIACEKVYESIMPMLDLDDKEIAEVFSLEEDELVEVLVNKKMANINMEVPSSSSEELINEVDLKMAHTLFRVYQDRILKEKEKKLV